MKRPLLWLGVSLLIASSAAAQAPPPTSAGTGFTALVNGGLGIQHDSGIEETAVGLAGLNVGAGWFVTPRAAVLFRFSGTVVKYEDLFDLQQSSGVLGGSVQYWLNDRFAIEGGAGFGYWGAEGESDWGFGLVLGASTPVFSRGSHHIMVGGEYAPAFTDPGAVHNFGITVGYQFRRR